MSKLQELLHATSGISKKTRKQVTEKSSGAKNTTKQRTSSMGPARRRSVKSTKPAGSSTDLAGAKPANVQEAEAFFARKAVAGDVIVKVNSHLLTLTHLSKVYWPEEGYTKFDLLRYYFTMSAVLLPYLRDRPLILKRYPNGITGPLFYQHNIEHPPEYLDTWERTDSKGDLVRYAIANNVESLLYLVNLGMIAVNPWSSTTENISCPDYFAFDLDPGEGATFDQVKRIAREVKTVLEEAGLRGYAKTSGSSGIHIYVPIRPEIPYSEIVPFAKKLAGIVAERHPKDGTVRRLTADRDAGQVYVDYLQNIEGKSLAVAYAVRERPGATVSAPIEWKELTKRLTLAQFTMKNMASRLKRKGDLFRPVLHQPQDLRVAMERMA